MKAKSKKDKHCGPSFGVDVLIPTTFILIFATNRDTGRLFEDGITIDIIYLTVLASEVMNWIFRYSDIICALFIHKFYLKYLAYNYNLLYALSNFVILAVALVVLSYYSSYSLKHCMVWGYFFAPLATLFARTIETLYSGEEFHWC